MGLRRGCSLSPSLFNTYMDEALRKWIGITRYLMITATERHVILPFYMQMIRSLVADTAGSLHLGLYTLNVIFSQCNLLISNEKIKVMAFCGIELVRLKTYLGEQD